MKTNRLIDDGKTIMENVEVVLKLQCSICGGDAEYECDYFDDDHGKDFAKYLDEAGWREMTSEQYGQIGYTCPECIDDEVEWEKKEGAL